jgi:cyclopropane fatty-acyl-phospholipid synthase-like methyltransferase
MKDDRDDIIAYYSELGFLFDELSDRSRFMNLGYLDLGRRRSGRSVAEAQRRLIFEVARAGAIKKGMRVLDVGCGLGGPALWLADEAGCRVTGIDPGRYQIDSIRKCLALRPEFTGFRALFGDAFFMPFRPVSFDRVTSVESAFHYPDKARFLRESCAVLKTGGMLVVADIVKSGEENGSWLSRRLGQALSAAAFFSVEDYKRAGILSGLGLVQFKDITGNVRRTMPLWRNTFLRKCPVLAKRYSVFMLAKIGLALLISPLLPMLTPFRYVILVFQKQPESR